MKFLFKYILLMLSFSLQAGRTKQTHRSRLNMIFKEMTENILSRVKIYRPNPLITENLQNVIKTLGHIDQDFLEKTNILDKLQQNRISTPEELKQYIRNCAFGHYMPADYNENFHPLNDYTEWRKNTERTTNQLLIAILLFSE